MERTTEELALITSYIQSNNLLYGKFFETFDKAYKIAKEFIKLYEGCDFELGHWEETLEDFVLLITKRDFIIQDEESYIIAVVNNNDINSFLSKIKEAISDHCVTSKESVKIAKVEKHAISFEIKQDETTFKERFLLKEKTIY